MPASRPNLLYLHAHDAGRYVQPYGHAVPTPNIQRLAEQGVLFRQAFCASPTCSPSRAALLTGQWAHCTGMLGLAHRGFRLSDYSRHIVNVLRSHGHTSVLAGVEHVGEHPPQLGYDRLLQPPGKCVRDVAPGAVEFLRSAGKAPQPFFLDVGFFETHRPFPDVADDAARYVAPPACVPDTPQTRRDMAAFAASARELDRGVGAVLGALDESGLGDDTLVICTTDHGIAFPGHKCNLTDHGIGIMLILRDHRDFAGGKVCDAMVSQIDLFPTICEVLGIDAPPWLQGSSMLPLVRGAALKIHDEIFAEVTYHAAYEPQRAVRTARWKYIRRYDERERPVLPNCDDGPSKSLLLEHGWGDHRIAQEMLFDLIHDPAEGANLASDARHATTLAEMRSRLDAWMRRTDDPLLRGPVPLPAGARATDVDAISP
jgi:arylsulfatase A-like enzyme